MPYIFKVIKREKLKYKNNAVCPEDSRRPWLISTRRVKIIQETVSILIPTLLNSLTAASPKNPILGEDLSPCAANTMIVWASSRTLELFYPNSQSTDDSRKSESERETIFCPFVSESYGCVLAGMLIFCLGSFLETMSETPCRLRIIAQPTSYARERYSSEINCSPRRPLRYIRAEDNGNSTYPYPTVEVRNNLWVNSHTCVLHI